MEGVFSFLLFAGLFYLMMRFGCGAHMVHGHSGHEHGANGAAGRAIDPVCGMPVERERAVTSEREGKTFYFCSRGCRAEYLGEAWPATELAASTS